MSRHVITPLDSEIEVIVGADPVFGYFGQAWNEDVDPDAPIYELDNAESRHALNEWVKSIPGVDVEIPGDIYVKLG